MSLAPESRAVAAIPVSGAAAIASSWVVRQRLHIAACATAGAWAWGVLLRARPSMLDLIIVASIVVCTYQWNRLTDIVEDEINCPDDLRDALAGRRGIEITVGAALMLAVVLTGFADATREKAILLSITVALGFAYGTPLLPRTRLKTMLIVKNVSSSFGWTLLTVVFPAAGRIARFDAALWLAAGCMFCAVFVVELLWDLRDEIGDRAADIRSVPVVFGARATRVLIIVLNTAPALLVVYGIASGRLQTAWLFVIVNSVLVVGFVSLFDDFSGVRRRWTHSLVMTQTLLLVGLGAVASL